LQLSESACDSFAVDLHNSAWRSRPLRTALRVATSLVRRRVSPLRDAVVPFDGGRSRIVADLSTSVGLILYRYGHVDPEMALLRTLLSPGDVFVDGGANVGLMTLVAAAQVGRTGTVIAFEPSSRTRRMLTRNVELNAFDWVRIQPDALDSGPGERKFVARRGNAAGLSSFAPAEATSKDDVELVHTVSLDEALAAVDAKRLTLIKLDLEGAELAALRGSLRVLETAGPDLIVEVEEPHLRRQGASSREVLDLVKGQGYHVYRMTWATPGKPGLVEDGTPRAGSCGPNIFATKRPDRIAHARIPIVT
jgi:FkbM family methyltransferase